MEREKLESGFVSEPGEVCYSGSAVRDVEVVRITKGNVLARGRRYGRLWFLKGLREELRYSTTMRRQLQKEFELHSRLRHPNIAQSIGFEEIEGLGPCIVQEWIDGETLHEALCRGSLTESDRRRVVWEITSAVAYMHRCGVVHRDIKPANIMVRNTGREGVLVDFGLADSDDYVEIKGAGGTQGFISPEQLESGGVNPADDVYSLGVVIKDMCPRYRRIADKCTGPEGKRPKDAGELLRMLDRRDRIPKIIIAVIIAAIVVGVTLFLSLRIRNLEHTGNRAKQNITALVRKNAENEVLVGNLRDSLSRMRQNVESASQALTRVKEYETMKRSAFKEGCGIIDGVLSDYDRNTFSKMTPEESGRFTGEMLRLVDDLKDKIEKYSSSLAGTSLTSEDQERLRMDLYNYEGVKIAEYQEKWQKKLFPGF